MSSYHRRMQQMIFDIEDGVHITDLIKKYPEFSFRYRDIERLIESQHMIDMMPVNRDVSVDYIYGKDNQAIINLIYASNQGAKICRISSYKKNGAVDFSTYHGEKVLILDHFDNNVKIDNLLSYIGNDYVMLPARRMSRCACYDKVYIVSDKPFKESVEKIIMGNAFNLQKIEKRVSRFLVLSKDGTIKECLSSSSIIKHKEE